MVTTPLYAGLLGLFYFYLSFRVVRLRRICHAGFGDAGDKLLMRAIRVHANFSEYVPLVIILMALAELQNVSLYLIHLVGILLLIGRASHAFGMSRQPEITGTRTVGMGLTFTALIIASLLAILPGFQSTLS